MILSPSSGWVSTIRRSAAVRRPGFERMPVGMPILPMSWRSAPSSSCFSVRSSRPSASPTRSERSLIERARERFDCGDERPLEPFVARGIRDRELRLLRDAAEQAKLAIAEVLALDESDDAAGTPVDLERRHRVATARHTAWPDDRLVLCRLGDVGIGVAAERVDGEVPSRELCCQLPRMPRLRFQPEQAVPFEVERCLGAAEDLRGEARHPRDDVVTLDERRELASELEERSRTLRLAPRRLEEARVLDRNGCVAGENLEQPHLVLVELVEAELRDDDHADDLRAVPERDGKERFLDRRRPFDLVPELGVRSVADDDRLADVGAAAGDPLADLDTQEVEGQRTDVCREAAEEGHGDKLRPIDHE